MYEALSHIHRIAKGSLALRLTLYSMDWQDCQTGQTMYQTIYKRVGATKNLFFAKLLLIGLLLSPESVNASLPCQGRFVNPITDICWSCILPISIGPAKVAKGWGTKNRDTKNPKSPICGCMKNNIPIPGIAIGFWEPARLVDVTRTPYCMVGLGGMQIGPNNMLKVSSYERGYGQHHAHRSFSHVHYYIYPLIYWLELLTDFMCLEQSSYDLAYMSEFDPMWNDEKFQYLMNPESFLFGNPAAQAACVIDCAAASLDMPIDSMYWCPGCLGNMYPMSGANADHVGGVQNSSLMVARMLGKLHRFGLAQETSTDSSKINGKLCRKSKAFLIKKSQYKLQLTYPRPTSGENGCWPLGLTDLIYSPGNEYPYDGQDWNYLIFSKRNCCLW